MVSDAYSPRASSARTPVPDFVCTVRMNEERDYHPSTHGVDKDGHVAKFAVSVFEAL